MQKLIFELEVQFIILFKICHVCCVMLSPCSKTMCGLDLDANWDKVTTNSAMSAMQTQARSNVRLKMFSREENSVYF